MSSLLRLIKAVRASSKLAPPEQLAKLLALAEAEPRDTGAQAVAAYEAWLQNEHGVALRFALRADELGSIPFPALLVLTAVHAEGNDNAATYGYAKRLASADRRDRTAYSFASAIAGSGVLSNRSRSVEREHLDSVAKAFDQWVAWSKEFVQAYEAGTI